MTGLSVCKSCQQFLCSNITFAMNLCCGSEFVVYSLISLELELCHWIQWRQLRPSVISSPWFHIAKKIIVPDAKTVVGAELTIMQLYLETCRCSIPNRHCLVNKSGDGIGGCMPQTEGADRWAAAGTWPISSSSSPGTLPAPWCNFPRECDLLHVILLLRPQPLVCWRWVFIPLG